MRTRLVLGLRRRTLLILRSRPGLRLGLVSWLNGLRGWVNLGRMGLVFRTILRNGLNGLLRLCGPAVGLYGLRRRSEVGLVGLLLDVGLAGLVGVGGAAVLLVGLGWLILGRLIGLHGLNLDLAGTGLVVAAGSPLIVGSTLVVGMALGLVGADDGG